MKFFLIFFYILWDGCTAIMAAVEKCGGRGVQESSSKSVFTCIVVIKDDFEVGNYHDDHQGSGRHGDGILLLHCSFSLMTNDSHIVCVHCFSIYLKNEITKNGGLLGASGHLLPWRKKYLKQWSL